MRPCLQIVDYGARGDGSAPVTEAIRQAIQAANAAGGGTVYIPAGQYVTGPIELVSNLVLHIDAGATLRFPAARLSYSKGRTQGIETIGPVPLIIKDSQDLELDGISSRLPVKGVPVLRLDHCPGAVVRNSHAFAGTGTFLSTGPGELRTIELIANTLRQAGKASEESTVDFRRER